MLRRLWKVIQQLCAGDLICNWSWEKAYLARRTGNFVMPWRRVRLLSYIPTGDTRKWWQTIFCCWYSAAFLLSRGIVISVLWKPRIVSSHMKSADGFSLFFQCLSPRRQWFGLLYATLWEPKIIAAQYLSSFNTHLSQLSWLNLGGFSRFRHCKNLHSCNSIIAGALNGFSLLKCRRLWKLATASLLFNLPARRK